MTTARTGLAGHFGDAWTGSSAGRGLNMMFMNAQKSAIDKTLSTPITQSAAYLAGESRGYNNATYQARDRIAQQQRFAQNSSNIASANQSMYDRAQASANMSTLDKVQLGLDVTGMSEIPVVSQLADLGSAGISFYNGDNLGGALSLGSMLPFAGKAFEGTRAARFAERISELGQEGHALQRHGGSVTDAQLIERARTGIAPDGSSITVRNGQTRLPPSASAFNSDELLVSADSLIRDNYLERALAFSKPEQQNKLDTHPNFCCLAN